MVAAATMTTWPNGQEIANKRGSVILFVSALICLEEKNYKSIDYDKSLEVFLNALKSNQDF